MSVLGFGPGTSHTLYYSAKTMYGSVMIFLIFFQVLDPSKRLGASDSIGYPSLRSHPFFSGIHFETLHEQTPPKIYPYLPGTSEHEEMRSRYRVSWGSRLSRFIYSIVNCFLHESFAILIFPVILCWPSVLVHYRFLFSAIHIII